MFLRPAEFRGFLSRNNYIDEIYDALAQDDTSDVVMAALHILRNTNSLPPMSMYKTPKNKEKSTLCRNEGNNAYVKGHYQRALGLYNEALLFAPNNSREMKLAYSNRSAVFHKLGAWTACYNDINRCFDMGCPSEIEVKLNKRRNDALQYLTRENFSKTIMNEAARKCIDPSAMRGNTQIPCASYDIKVVTSAAMPKVIAATNIKAGAVLASEQAYVSYNNASNSSFSCHFCQKKELNLIPCDGCCFALFCDENCKNKCMKQYHENECKIMDAIMQLCWGHMPNLMVKAFLKLRSSCKSWEELIAASYNMGISRIKSSSIQEVYDTNNKFSVLCFKDDKTFVHGDLYNACFVVAAILHYLEDQIPAFLPKSTDKKQQAMRASARIMMFMAVYLNPLHIIQAQTVIRFDKSNYGTENFGLFPFIAKLKNSCNPNSIIANNNNKLVLIALGPIKSGEELTVSYLWHKQDTLLSERLLNIKTFIFYGTVCSCKRCSSSEMNDDKEVLSKYQKKYFSQLDLDEIESRLKNIEINHVYSKLLKALTVLSDVPNSEEYIKIYSLWRRCMFFFETIWSDNNILDYNTE